MHRSRELSREVTQLFPGEDGRRSSRERHGERVAQQAREMFTAMGSIHSRLVRRSSPFDD